MNEQDERLLRRSEVEKMIGLGRSAIYDAMRAGRFPAPIKIGVGSVRWKMSEIRAHIDGCERATGEAA